MRMPRLRWIVQTIEYVPRRRSSLLKLPELLVDEWNRTGPLVTVTLWELNPRQTHLTVVPWRTVSERGPKKLSLTETLRVPASAGSASAAARTSTRAIAIRGLRMLFLPPVL